MKHKYLFLLILFLKINSIQSQTRVAILDFENTSGIAKYDGFGKAMSNMLITDLKNSIHPKKITFLERSQLNKILEEQGLQKSKNFDDNTAVNFGKLAGVKYVLVGSVYVLDGVCNINSRMVDVETSEIIHAKESNGQIVNWLNLKTVLAEELSGALNSPIKIEDEYSSEQVSETVITQYSKVIDKMDEGDVDGAKNMTDMLAELEPNFKYFEEIKYDIEFLKKEIEALKGRLSNIENVSSKNKVDINNLNEIVSNNAILGNPNSPFEYLANARIYKNTGNYSASIKAYDNYFSFDSTKFIEPYREYIEIVRVNNIQKYTQMQKEYKKKGKYDDFYNFIYLISIENIEERLKALKIASENENFPLFALELSSESIRRDQLNWSTFNIDYNLCQIRKMYKNHEKVFEKYLSSEEVRKYFIDPKNCNNGLTELQSSFYTGWRDLMETTISTTTLQIKNLHKENPEVFTLEYFINIWSKKWGEECETEYIELLTDFWDKHVK